MGTRPSLDPGSALARVHLEPVTGSLTVSSAVFLEYYFEFYFENKARFLSNKATNAKGSRLKRPLLISLEENLHREHRVSLCYNDVPQ